MLLIAINLPLLGVSLAIGVRLPSASAPNQTPDPGVEAGRPASATTRPTLQLVTSARAA